MATVIVAVSLAIRLLAFARSSHLALSGADGSHGFTPSEAALFAISILKASDSTTSAGPPPKNKTGSPPKVADCPHYDIMRLARSPVTSVGWVSAV